MDELAAPSALAAPVSPPSRSKRTAKAAVGPAKPAQSPASLADILLSAGSTVACHLNDELHCNYLSDNWEKISGFDAGEDMGDGLKERIAPDHVRKLHTFLSTPSSSNSVRFQLKHRDGNWRWCELRSTKETNEDYRICLIEDVTDLIATQGRLEKLKLEADLANKSRSEFLANMSHELRTPLNAILGFAQMIESGTYGDLGHAKYHDYVQNMAESGSTLLSKINDLLEIANIDAGSMALNDSSTDINGIIRQAIEFHSHRAFAERITLREHLPQKEVLAVVDRLRLLQAVTNVLSNAIRYNQAGGTVDIFCTQRKDGGINITVEDSGAGIPPGHLHNILSAFRQDNSFFARSRDCVGLGLALSKEIVKLHNGRIEIESEAGVGTKLTIRLPRERTARKAAAAPVKPLAESLLSHVS